jgi:DNA-binding NarL/FixJ family response regulator
MLRECMMTDEEEPTEQRKVLLLEDDGIFRHAILMNVEHLFGSAEIFGFNRHDALETAIADGSIASMHDFDVAILDPGVPPVSPPGSETAFEDRIGMISSVVSRLRPSCNIVVLTGSYDEAEGEVMLRMGVNKYLSKTSLDLIALRKHLSCPEQQDEAVTSEDRSRSEKFVSGLTEKEKYGLAVHQKIYDEAGVAGALNVDIDTIRKYVTRAKKRARSRGMA